ncbi:MAG: copper chaperone PCu(A)C [Rhodospirillales bacterium]
MKRIFNTAIAALVSAAWCGLALPAQAHDSGVTVKNVWVRAAPPGVGAGAAYAEIHSEDGDSLIGAESPAAKRVELHTHVEKDGVMKMTRVESVEIPEGGVVKLQPGGLHLMLTGLNQQLEEGAKIPVTFIFQHMDEVETEAVILAVGAKDYAESGAHAAHTGEHGGHAESHAEDHEGHHDWRARLRGLWDKLLGR